MSAPGSESCHRCDLGEFWENHTCHSCPEDQHGDGVHCRQCPQGYTVMEGLCVRAAHKTQAIVIGLAGLAVLLAAGIIFATFSLRARIDIRREETEMAQMNAQMVQIELE